MLDELLIASHFSHAWRNLFVCSHVPDTPEFIYRQKRGPIFNGLLLPNPTWQLGRRLSPFFSFWLGTKKSQLYSRKKRILLFVGSFCCVMRSFVWLSIFLGSSITSHRESHVPFSILTLYRATAAIVAIRVYQRGEIYDIGFYVFYIGPCSNVEIRYNI